jgi:hypothetical protein
MVHPYTPPQFDLKAFHCPLCGAYAHQHWSFVRLVNVASALDNLKVAYCSHCGQFNYWVGGLMIWPDIGAAPFANPDMPDAPKADYEEARQIVNRSPRGAAALLRLAIQKICTGLGVAGDLNAQIGTLVRDGLPQGVAKALDIVRVVGNNAVHPGVIDMKDDVATANRLFALVNIIVEKMISEPAKIDALFEEKVPEGTKSAIAKRDRSPERSIKPDGA